jgi:hypothetical protein
LAACFVRIKKEMENKKKRNRNSVSLTPDGILTIREALHKKNWTNQLWADFSLNSISTIKRLLAGTKIDRTSFDNLLITLNLALREDWIVKKNFYLQDKLLIKTILANDISNLERSFINSQLGLLMTGIFTEDKRPEIDRTLRHLQSLLIDTKIVFGKDNGSVFVSGNFSEENKEIIAITISHLETLLTHCTVTL